MEIDDNSYILGYWFASKENDDCWYMMIVKEGDNVWKGQYTFRYNKEEENEDDPFSGKDEKNIYNFTISNTSEDEVINKMDVFFQEIKSTYNKFSDYFIIKGNAEKFIEIAKTKHYMHIKAGD